MSRVIDKLAAKTEDAQDAWLRLVAWASFGLLNVLCILRGLIHGLLHMGEWIVVVQFWACVVISPLVLFLLIVHIGVLRKVRRRELDTSLSD